jgi:hypothetical protein
VWSQRLHKLKTQGRGPGPRPQGSGRRYPYGAFIAKKTQWRNFGEFTLYPCHDRHNAFQQDCFATTPPPSSTLCASSAVRSLMLGNVTRSLQKHSKCATRWERPAFPTYSKYRLAELEASSAPIIIFESRRASEYRIAELEAINLIELRA